MKHSNSYPSWEHYPRHLTEAEASDPWLVIDDFFEYASLPQVRDELWGWLQMTVCGGSLDTLDNEERDNLFYFYSKLGRLIESAHLLHSSKNQ